LGVVRFELKMSMHGGETKISNPTKDSRRSDLFFGEIDAYSFVSSLSGSAARLAHGEDFLSDRVPLAVEFGVGDTAATAFQAPPRWAKFFWSGGLARPILV
jgi:hypothetical protein